MLQEDLVTYIKKIKLTKPNKPYRLFIGQARITLKPTTGLPRRPKKSRLKDHVTHTHTQNNNTRTISPPS